MANHKSAIKRDKQNKVRRLRNRMNKSTMKTAVRGLEEVMAGGDQAQTLETLRKVTSVISKTATKGAINKKTAARKVSRLTRRVNKLQAAAA
ncbi:MAG: 30S ribosomal protein S20 [Desulfobulbaceae bacterium A2]|nr:MAG: 30S ribosomal protein S20 [Desulfobulbaceae bacterium A2]